MNVGIIGGADGPTSVFVSSPILPIIIGGVILIAVIVAIAIFITKR